MGKSNCLPSLAHVRIGTRAIFFIAQICVYIYLGARDLGYMGNINCVRVHK
jgi:hypothetical protein